MEENLQSKGFGEGHLCYSRHSFIIIIILWIRVAVEGSGYEAVNIVS